MGVERVGRVHFELRVKRLEKVERVERVERVAIVERVEGGYWYSSGGTSA